MGGAKAPPIFDKTRTKGTMMSMKVAHFAGYHPNACGQYHTVKDLVLAEQAKGIDAGFVHCTTDAKGQIASKPDFKDGDFEIHNLRWGIDADIIVRHTCLPQFIEHSGIPIIMALHGRPESTYMLEFLDVMAVWNLVIMKANEGRNYEAAVYFWEEYKEIWETYMPPEKLNYIPAMVDMKKFNPEGKKHDFKKWSGSPNIVVADKFRHDITPFNVMQAAAKFQKEICPTAKLHCYGLPPAKKSNVLVRGLSKAGVIGQAHTNVKNLDEIFRSADMLITPHVIATRIIREALASGLPIVAGTGCRYTPFTADSRDIGGFAREIGKCWKLKQGTNGLLNASARKTAMENFRMDKAADAMIEVFEKVLRKRKAKPINKPYNEVHIINEFIRKYKYKTYLEIGIDEGKTFRNVNCSKKVGVDPLPKVKCNYHMTSDMFFSQLADDIRLDIIFIDGNHIEDYVDRDIDNSLNHISDNGTILLHDCNPKTEELQCPYGESVTKKVKAWCGQVWRAYLTIKLRRNDLEFYVIDIGHGMGVIRKGQQDPIEDLSVPLFMSYEYFDRNRKRLLNLISIEEWMEKMREEVS